MGSQAQLQPFILLMIIEKIGGYTWKCTQIALKFKMSKFEGSTFIIFYQILIGHNFITRSPIETWKYLLEILEPQDCYYVKIIEIVATRFIQDVLNLDTIVMSYPGEVTRPARPPEMAKQSKGLMLGIKFTRCEWNHLIGPRHLWILKLYNQFTVNTQSVDVWI